MDRFFDQSPVLVKIDAEGAEPEVLKSMAALIVQHRPDLLIEVLSTTETSLNKLRFLLNGGYELFHIRPEGLIRRDWFVADEHRDYALLPT